MNHSERNIAILVNPLPGNEKACAVTENLDVLLMGMSVQHRIFDQQWPLHLDDFTDVLVGWLLDVFLKIGCDTALSVMELSVEDLVRRTDLEEETILDVMRILKEEFED